MPALEAWTLDSAYLQTVFWSLVMYQAINWISLALTVPDDLRGPDRAEWATRVASSVHAVFAFVVCVRIGLDDPGLFWGRDPVFMRHPDVEFIFAVCVGYFVSDFAMVLAFRIEPMWHSLVHHFLGAVGLALSTASGGAYAWFGYFLLINAETTTPFNNHAWFARKLGGRSVVAERLFTANWFLFRIGCNVVVFARLIECWHEFVNQHWLLLTSIACNIIFLTGIHIALGVFSLVSPDSESALPMPAAYIRWRTRGPKHKAGSKKHT